MLFGNVLLPRVSGLIKITPNIVLNDAEVKFTFVRAPGPGGQNVNKVATAAQLRFNILHSAALSEAARRRLTTLAGNKITLHGELIIKASRYRTQERNKQDALDRLIELIRRAAVTPKKRKKTQPTFASTQRRLTKKKKHSQIKSLRSNKPNFE
jgi:ribosome-associated protein